MLVAPVALDVVARDAYSDRERVFTWRKGKVRLGVAR